MYNEAGGTAARLATENSGTPLPIPLFTTTTETIVTSVTQPDNPAHVDYSAACYQTNNPGVSACTTAENNAGGLCFGKANCACSTSSLDGSSCAQNNHYRLAVQITDEVTTVTPTGQTDNTKGRDWNFDDWARFFYVHGIPIDYLDVDNTPQVYRAPVITYTIDVFNKQQNADHTGLMLSAANVGGGRYFAARNEESIQAAIDSIISDILSVNSTFAAVALPLSATNRAQNENQVFIGMFRPDQFAAPRWFGNLKQYQVGIFGGTVQLADARTPAQPAVNPLTNFASECAESFWSEDSAGFWQDKGVTPPPRSVCTTLPAGDEDAPWSDLPDGPFVEKGGAAQQARGIATSADRVVYTVSSNSLTPLSSTFNDSLGGNNVRQYTRGFNTSGDTARIHIHGDVVHSRPLPINYGDNIGTTVFYGANDGLFRAISAQTGEERWSLLAPEHFSQMQRLYDNEPLVAFPNQDPSANPEPKDYFFDGSTGQLVIYNNDNEVDLAYIYPTMRRGGRMVYALDVSNPVSPSLLWRIGCPNTSNDSGCTSSDFTSLGQTWSLPQPAHVGGYPLATEPLEQWPEPLRSPTPPILIFGAGYDNCEDTDAPITTCDASSKGRGIYIVDAYTGDLIRHFETDGAVAADIKVVDTDYDGLVDFAYAVDLSGNVWRINFVNPVTKDALAPADWSIHKIAYTADSRKLFNAPSVLPYKNTVYLAFGSGNRERPLETNYPYEEDIDDRFFVFLDYPTDNTAIDLDGILITNYSVPTDCDAQGIYPTSSQRGWFMSLPGQGEQVVTTSAIAAGSVFFNTYRPGGATAGMCTLPLGISTAYRVNLFTASGMIGVNNVCGGDRSVEIPGGGMPIAPVIGTVVPTNPGCVGDNCADEPPVTFCIGCEGLEPVELSPVIQQTRSRIYWNVDTDR
ncbi:pilus assembly protein [Nitrincola alkalilacustris]|uniref:pilus assembly protein n=1 Tax=Nitrincola alkalilacustris TaxID=1571224 RepID=UPI00145687B9|nr:PilC/PilY family type IV pilus protein [Nitrincola alkalilacustris]